MMMMMMMMMIVSPHDTRSTALLLSVKGSTVKVTMLT